MPNEGQNQNNESESQDNTSNQQTDTKDNNDEETINNNNDASGEQMNKLCFSLKHFLKEGFSSGSVDSHIPPPEPKLTGARPKIPSTTSSSSVNLMNNCSSGNNPTDTTADKRSLRFFNYMDPAVLSDMSYPAHSGDSQHPSSSSHEFHRSYSTYDLGFANSKSKPDTRRRRFMHRKDDDTGPDPSNFNKTVSPEISMALPDFVQDHIALEMFYSRGGGGNGSSNISPLSFEYDQLPDFAINENEANSRVLAGSNKDVNMAFDLMCNSSEINRNSEQQIPLDLPNVAPSLLSDPMIRSNQEQQQQRSSNDIPLDLTSRNNGFGDINHPGQLSNADTFQTLPDFLSDGHIHSSGRQNDNGLESFDDCINEPLSRSQMQRLRTENVRLRQELDNSMCVNDEQSRRIRELNEYIIKRMQGNTAAATTSESSGFNEHLSHQMDKADENKRTNKKATAATDSQVTDLKKKVKQLTAQVEMLRQENDILKEGGAVGGVGVRAHHSSSSDRYHQFREISSDLMVAASNAEGQLRQLMGGVENLRLLATQIESINNVIVSSDDFSDCEDDFTGPAL